MTFDVCLIHKAKTMQIAEFVPERCIRIVAVADGVEIRGLDHPDIALHACTVDDPSAGGVDFVSVHSAQFDGSAVEKQLPIPDFERAETDPEMPDVADRSVVTENQGCRIEKRFFV